MPALNVGSKARAQTPPAIENELVGCAAGRLAFHETSVAFAV